ncbi:MAG: ATP-binding protein [Cytophagaceae bacterium]
MLRYLNKSTPNSTQQNCTSLENELTWFAYVLQSRFNHYFNNEGSENIESLLPPDLSGDESNYAQLVRYYNMDFNGRIILMLALCPYLRPQALDIFFTKNSEGRMFTEFGGKGFNESKFIPTIQTALFLLAGNDLSKRLYIENYFETTAYLRGFNVIELHGVETNSIQNAEIRISMEVLTYITTGKNYKPGFSSSFPASMLSTKMDWQDLVIEPHVLEEINEINAWINYGQVLLEEYGLGKMIKRGYRTLFYGPPGTGKTLTASLLGKANNMDVYRIDLSMVVSKYIGETEKNLSNLFDRAENKNWILFFDEADALFGKRTQTKDSKDRYANQEISYLLQRIEDFPGLVILATNLKANMDDAFVRRFQSMIYFPMPGADLRLRLWKNAFNNKFRLDTDVDLKQIAEKYEMAGGAIINVISYCGLMALHRGSDIIMLDDIIHGIRKEFRKEGKTV